MQSGLTGAKTPPYSPSLVLLGDRRVTVITLHGAERLHPLRHTCDHSLGGTGSCGFKATKHGEISGWNSCTERQTNTCLCFYGVKRIKTHREVTVAGRSNHTHSIGFVFLNICFDTQQQCITNDKIWRFWEHSKWHLPLTLKNELIIREFKESSKDHNKGSPFVSCKWHMFNLAF